jgi:hypothetical protein
VDAPLSGLALVARETTKSVRTPSVEADAREPPRTLVKPHLDVRRLTDDLARDPKAYDARRRTYFEKEDKVLRAMPKYEEARKDLHRRAYEALRTQGLTPRDTQAVRTLAQREIDAFWGAGSLAYPGAYDHAYRGRAFLEIAQS